MYQMPPLTGGLSTVAWFRLVSTGSMTSLKETGGAPPGTMIAPATRCSRWRGTALRAGSDTSSQTTQVADEGIVVARELPGSSVPSSPLGAPTGVNSACSAVPARLSSARWVEASRTSTWLIRTERAVTFVSRSS